MEKGSSSSASSSSSGDSINGLKFGKTIYFEGMASGLAAAPPRSLAKKGRTAVVHGGQPPRCQVEGCLVDLSDSKAYYCRHKVCGMHSKSPTVIVGGLEQRFCQQCSRFHKLSEFDQGKRSCRRRLAGHNERRRKPPAGPLLASHSFAHNSAGPKMDIVLPEDGKRTGYLAQNVQEYGDAILSIIRMPESERVEMAAAARNRVTIHLSIQASHVDSTKSPKKNQKSEGEDAMLNLEGPWYC